MGEILDGKILIFNLLTMEVKKLNSKADSLNYKVENLAEFENFYNNNECVNQDIQITKINAKDFRNLYQQKPNKTRLNQVKPTKTNQKQAKPSKTNQTQRKPC